MSQNGEGVTSRFWKPKQAAQYLGISVNTLYYYVRPQKKKYKNAPRLIGPRPPFRRLSRNVIRFPIEAFKQWADRTET